MAIDNQLVSLPCYDKKSSNKKDYGLRLCLVDIRKGHENLIYKSAGAGDSYYMKLKSLVNKSQLLVLAETGAEFSYGVDAYMLNGQKMTYMGNIDTVVDDGGSAESVVPFLMVSKHEDVITFSFTRDVLRPDGKGGYSTYSKHKIKYQYAGDKLSLITTP